MIMRSNVSKVLTPGLTNDPVDPPRLAGQLNVVVGVVDVVVVVVVVVSEIE